jgi:tRNA-dihydrouridine synthase A
MIVDEAINRGDKKKLLEFNIKEKPVALQLGGSSPKLTSKRNKNWGRILVMSKLI